MIRKRASQVYGLDDQAERVNQIEEGQFSDVKARAVHDRPPSVRYVLTRRGHAGAREGFTVRRQPAPASRFKRSILSEVAGLQRAHAILTYGVAQIPADTGVSRCPRRHGRRSDDRTAPLDL